MERIRESDLNYLVSRINQVTGSPEVPWTTKAEGKGGKLTANIGNYHLSYAYGGVSLERMVNESGGVESISGMGHVPKRVLYNWMRAYLAGLTHKCDSLTRYHEARIAACAEDREIDG